MAVDLREAGSRVALGRSFDHRDQLIWSIALLSGELYEFVHLRQDRAALRSSCDGDATTSPELEQSLFAQQAKGTKDRVRVHAEHCREILGQRHALTGPGLTVGDRATDLGSDLLEERQRVGRVDLDMLHSATNLSFMDSTEQLELP